MDRNYTATSGRRFWSNVPAHELIGIVHRVQYALHAEHLLAEPDCQFPRAAAVGQIDILAQVVAGFALQWLQELVALRAHRGCMHEVDAQSRKAFEHALVDAAQQVQAGLRSETEHGTVEPGLGVGCEHRRWVRYS